MSRPVEDRFWEKVDKTDSCWLWTGTRVNGYGYIRVRGKMQRSHRLSYQWLAGPIPDGLVLDHLCRVKNCVNPDHLELVTVRENSLRGNGPTATNARKTHCKHGHEFTPENTYTTPGGKRNCRECIRVSSRRYAARRLESKA